MLLLHNDTRTYCNLLWKDYGAKYRSFAGITKDLNTHLAKPWVQSQVVAGFFLLLQHGTLLLGQ